MKSKSSSGAAIAEMVIAMPLFVLILFGILQWGYIFSAYVTVRNASMIGVRSFALWNGTQGNAEAAAKAALSPMLNPADSAACPTSGSPLCVSCSQSGTDYACSMNYKLKLFAPFVVPGSSGGRFTLKSQATMH